jgi:hypothetical protein
MQEYENTAGGMSYRTMNGIDFREINKYLEGSNQKNSLEILNKNKEYYIASANKTIARLELSKERVENTNILPETANIISDKISSALYWLEKLKKDIKNVNNKSEIIKKHQYKKWHAVKLLPSAAEGLMIITRIEEQINNSNETSNKNLIENISQHLEKSKTIFLELLNLGELSDFQKAEILRIEGYNEIVIANSKLPK